MTTRVGDLAQHRLMTDLMLGAQARVRGAQEQIGSGKRAELFRDLAGEADRLLTARDALRRSEQYLSNNELVDTRLAAMEHATSSLIEVGGRLRVLLIQRLNDASAVPGTLAAEAEHLLDMAVEQLNAESGGRYLFAGSRTDGPPVALDPAFANLGQPDDTYYRGDDVALSVRADDGLELTYGVTADAGGFPELIGALRAAVEGDRGRDDGLLENALDLVNRALPGIEDRRAEIGARRGILDRVNAAHGDTQLLLERVVSGIEDVDLAEAVTRLAREQATLQGAMLTVARLEALSLANFLN